MAQIAIQKPFTKKYKYGILNNNVISLHITDFDYITMNYDQYLLSVAKGTVLNKHEFDEAIKKRNKEARVCD